MNLAGWELGSSSRSRLVMRARFGGSGRTATEEVLNPKLRSFYLRVEKEAGIL